LHSATFSALKVFKIRAILAFPIATATFRIALDSQSLDHPPQKGRSGFAIFFDRINIGFFPKQRLAYRAWRNTACFALLLRCLATLVRLEPMLQAVPTKQVGALRELGTTSHNMDAAKLAHKFIYKFLVCDELICRNFKVCGIRCKVHVVPTNANERSETDARDRQ
jgi:hypothetical protein